VNITSIAVKQPVWNLGLSNTARSGLTGYAKTLSAELAGHGVTVNNICPGTIFTDRIRQLLGPDTEIDNPPTSGPLAELLASNPSGRMGCPDELGALAAFICSQQAAYITGASIPIDGGAFKGLF